MNRGFRNFILSLASVLALGMAAAALWAHHRAQAARDQLAPARLARAAAAQTCSDTFALHTSARPVDPNVGAGTTPASRRTVPPKAEAFTSYPSTTPPAQTATSAVAEASAAALWTDPALRRLYRDSEQGRVLENYAALFQQLALSQDQTRALQSLLLSRSEAQFSTLALLAGRGISPESADGAQMLAEVVDSFRRDFVSLLGDTAYTVFQDYERKLPVWQLVNNFAGAAAMEGAPVTLAQAEELVAVLAEASPAFQLGGVADPDEIEWPAAVEEAEPVLSPPQRQLFMNFRPIYPIVSPSE